MLTRQDIERIEAVVKRCGQSAAYYHAAVQVALAQLRVPADWLDRLCDAVKRQQRLLINWPPFPWSVPVSKTEPTYEPEPCCRDPTGPQ